MSRIEIRSLITWGIIAAVLVVLFNVVPGLNAMPTGVFLIPALILLVWRFSQAKARGGSRWDNLAIFGQSARTMSLLGGCLYVSAFVWAFAIIDVANQSDQGMLYLVVVPVISLLTVGSASLWIGIYVAVLRRDTGS